MGNAFSIQALNNNDPASQTVGPATGRTNESVGGLKVSESYACPSTGAFPCSIIVDGTITSSSVTLSRDILGKLEVPDTGTASDEWTWDVTVGWKDGNPYQDLSKQNSGGARVFNADGTPGGLKGFGSGNHYKVADPSRWGKDGIDTEGYRWMNDYLMLMGYFNSDLVAWKADQDKHSKTVGTQKQVYIWNPSDDGIVEMNRETYGALTKLFLKPTLPFKVSFRDGIGKTQEVPQVTLISVFHPCPIRIESVQYDAVIQIGDFRGLSGTECTQQVDESSRAVKALNKQTAVLERRIAKAQEQVLTELKKGFTSPSYITARSNADRLIAKKDALALPKKRVCEPRDGAADKLVIFVPLKINDRPKPGAQYEQTRFVNTFANKIPSILGAQPDRYLGYPDVPAATQNDWKLSSILDPTDCYYTWEVTLTGQSQPVTVVFMKNPIAILSSDMGSIKRLPITPPSHVFHSNPTNVRFKSCPPRDISGVPVPCSARAPPQKVPGPKTQADIIKNNKPAFTGTDWLAILLGILGVLGVIIGVWLGVKFAAGWGGDKLRGVGDYLGKSLAGAYVSARRTASRAIGTSSSGPLPARRPAAPEPPPPPPPPRAPSRPRPPPGPELASTDGAANRLNLALTSSNPLTTPSREERLRRHDQRNATGTGGKRKKRRRRTGRKV
jgi:hypothetical protein